jgi:hypothetical protein
MTFEAGTLAVASVLHLTGVLDGGSKPVRPSGAGVAEAVICIVLLAGAWALVRGGTVGRRAALAATGFAIFGFIVGLTFTVPAGAPVDIAYHVTMLPVLIATAALLARGGVRDKARY